MDSGLRVTSCSVALRPPAIKGEVVSRLLPEEQAGVPLNRGSDLAESFTFLSHVRRVTWYVRETSNRFALLSSVLVVRILSNRTPRQTRRRFEALVHLYAEYDTKGNDSDFRLTQLPSPSAPWMAHLGSKSRYAMADNTPGSTSNQKYLVFMIVIPRHIDPAHSDARFAAKLPLSYLTYLPFPLSISW